MGRTYLPSIPSHEDSNRAPTEVVPSTPVPHEGETPSIPDTPHFDPDEGDPSPEEPAIGVASKIEAKERMTQTPPLLSRLIQGYLDHIGIEACPYHQMDHGVRDPECDHCKRALGPLYHHKIKGNRHLPVFTFDFSGPHPHRVGGNVAQYLLVCVWSLGHMRLVWAFGVESRQASVVLPCLQSSFEDLRSLTRGSRPPMIPSFVCTLIKLESSCRQSSEPTCPNKVCGRQLILAMTLKGMDLQNGG